MKAVINKVTSLMNRTELDSTLESLTFTDQFLSLAINKNTSTSVGMDRVLQVDDMAGASVQYLLFEEHNKMQGKVFRNGKLAFSLAKDEGSYISTYIDKVAQAFQYAIEASKTRLAQSPSASSDLSSETRGLEWLKTTLTVLKSAINQSADDPNLLFEAQLFVGKRKQDDDFQVRIQCLSLDFLLLFFSDGRLNVTVWNYKNLDPASVSEPTFKGEFAKLKQPVFDEFILLLVEMSKASTKLS